MSRGLLLLLVLSTCAVPREPEGRGDTQCAWCHGDPQRGGDKVARAAPPRDLRGNTGVEFPSVGAHLRHLEGSAIFPQVACASCHPVPDVLSAARHNDGITQLTVGWTRESRTCADSTCHGPVSGVWTRPRVDACGSCHGVPPPAPHPSAGACAGCHGALSPSTHVDGRVTLLVPARCNACHGTDDTGAPPRSLDGGTSAAQRGVGAHTAHLAGGAASKPVACETCHAVPATVAAPGHANGAIELAVAVGFDAGSLSCATSCHFGQSPPWTAGGPLACTGCHAAPPSYPHPQLADCAACHGNDRSRHVNGMVDVAVPAGCDGCHGSATSPAPPRDVDGGTDTSRPGVGAHQVHVAGRGIARPVPCGECHLVPAAVRDLGHLDGVTQVRFSGAATANLAMPTYEGGSCANVACHDISNWTAGAPGGGTATRPVWTSVDGGQATCTSCHGQPPPLPHPARADCASCHDTAVMKHVNGHVDFGP